MTERNLKLEEWLDDLCVRFIINLPEDDLKDIPRICFQVEEAQWYYEDFIRPLDPSLPSMSLRNFCLRIFAHCPLLSPFSQGHHMRAFEDFLAYKTRVPVRGAIMLNENMDSVVLVKGWKKGASWSFPRGKIAKDEDDLTCAIREVYEETGFEIEAAGLVPKDRDVKSIEVNMREQQMRLFVFRNVPMETYFQPRTRKEISKIEWWRLSDLPAFRKKGHQQAEVAQNANPNKFYMVAPFLVPLRKWVIEQKKKDAKRVTSNQYLSAGAMSYDEGLTEEDQGAESAAQASTYEKYSAPELDTLEGATAALSRLLKIQPATQGLQTEVIPHPSTSTKNENSGSALLALLHSKPAASSQPIPANAPPRTPLDLINNQPPMPKTPHHQAPRPPHFSSMPPPPAFQIQQQQDEAFTYRQPNQQTGPSVQNMPHYPQNANSIPQHVGQQNIQRPPGNPNSYQPQHLIHPQPLPPHVQRAVFTGGPVHSPMVPQPVQQLPPTHLTSTVSVAVNNPQFPGLHAPMIPATIKQTSKLTSHSLALLNAFKTRDQASDDIPNPIDLPLRRFAEAPATPLRATPQELPAVESSRAGPIGPPPIMVQHNVTGINPSALTPKQPISDAHKSTLLGIFKSPTTQTSLLAKPVSATALPTSNTPSAVELSAVEPLSVNASTTSALLNDKRTPDHMGNGAVPVLNPESTLPFRAMQILSRPTQPINKEILPEREARDTQPKPTRNKPTSRENRNQNAQSPGKPFQPQILKRPQANSGSSRITQSPTMIQPNTASMPPPPAIDRRPNRPEDHKQNLLSLFGKTQTTVVSPSQSQALPVMETAELPMQAAARSRVGSLVSGEGNASRRGSQTPISPADKGFLLNYLDAFANSQR